MSHPSITGDYAEPPRRLRPEDYQAPKPETARTRFKRLFDEVGRPGPFDETEEDPREIEGLKLTDAYLTLPSHHTSAALVQWSRPGLDCESVLTIQQEDDDDRTI